MRQKRPARLLLVDDDPGLLRLLSIRLRTERYDVEGVDNAAAALDATESYQPDLIITDLRMDGMDGIELLQSLQRRWPGLPVLLMTAHGTIPDAVAATQAGAFGFLTKPIDKNELLDHVRRALKVSQHASSNDNEWATGVVTRSPQMTEMLARAKLLAEGEGRILIRGASGSGKSVIARALHRASPRHEGPYIAVNCSALAENLVESEMFGYVDAAVPGARDSSRQGAFQRAHGGTLLLEEIGDMPIRLQVKLLRVLEERAVRPVGGVDPVAIDVRLISSTHSDLERLIIDGRLRQDLFYRLNESCLSLPTLANRREDIALLANHFLELAKAEAGISKLVYAPEAIELLLAADWPGNVRELRNVVRGHVATCGSPIISASLVQESLGGSGDTLPSFADARDEFIRNYLAQLLKMTGGNVSQAARMAKRNRTDFYKLLSRHQLDPDVFKHL